MLSKSRKEGRIEKKVNIERAGSQGKQAQVRNVEFQNKQQTRRVWVRESVYVEMSNICAGKHKWRK